MARKRDKFGMLLLGTFIGIIAGISVMWWASSMNRTEWISFTTVRDLINNLMPGKDDQLAQIKTPFEKDKQNKQKKNNFNSNDSINSKQLADSLLLADSISADLLSQGGADNYYIDESNLPDTLLWFGKIKSHGSRSDSLKTDSVNHISKHSGSFEVVKRDIMLEFRLLRVNGKNDSIDRKSAYLDSLLTDDKLSQHPSTSSYRVEFWKSPINYQGYRVYQNKIIVFGFEKFDQLSLEYINKKLYLKNQNNYFLMERAENFRPLRALRKIDIQKN